MHLYFGGAEQGGWARLLEAEGVKHVSLSYMGLRRRIKRLDRWRLEDHFPEDTHVFVDSGAYTLNKDDSKYTENEAVTLANDYMAFVAANLDRIEFASEFDASILGWRAIEDAREDFWSDLPADKWMPVWHADYGLGSLEAMADHNARLGILQDDAAGDLTPLLNRLAGRTKLHGVAMTKMDAMKEVDWASVGSTSWLSPTQYGDTFVWTGRELKRYPKKYKDQGRKRHRSYLDGQGFDTAKIEADDNHEILRLSLWSWQRYVESINPDGVTTVISNPFEPNAEPGPGAVGTPAPTVRNDEVDIPAGKKLLPVLGFTYEEVKGTDDDGHETTREEPRISVPRETLLRCDTCFMKDKCPAMKPGSDCAYDIPVQIRTPAQIVALQDALLEMQTQRVLLMRMIEQTEGGYADPNLSTEIGRLQKMIKEKMDGGKDRLKLTLEASSGGGQPGMISRIFGNDAGEKLAAIEAPQPVEDIVNQANIFDAEVVE